MQTVTFYSYKGGSGRSLLLANAAQFLALAGKRVVALDLDFEAPGLHYKLNIGQAGQRATDILPERGVVDYLLAASDGAQPERLSDYVAPVALPPGSGELWLMPAGAAPSGEYWRRLTTLAQRGMLGDPDSEVIATFLELKARLEDELDADFLLIDARTGITELSGIATALLADKVVCLMLDSPESLAGTRAVLRSLAHAVRLKGQDSVEVLAVLSRVPGFDGETEQRVISYLNEDGPSPDEVLSLNRLFVLPTQQDVARTERILLDGGQDGAASTLGQSYLRLLSELVPADSGRAKAALDRQEAIRAMRDWLISAHLHPQGVRITEIYEGLLFEPGRRYTDLTGGTEGPDGVLSLVAEYAEDLARSEAWRWWQENTSIHSVMLFNLDEGGQLRRRAFTRVAPGRLQELSPD